VDSFAALFQNLSEVAEDPTLRSQTHFQPLPMGVFDHITSPVRGLTRLNEKHIKLGMSVYQQLQRLQISLRAGI